MKRVSQSRECLQAVSQLVGELDNRWGSVIVSCCCEKLVDEARWQFRNPEEGERPPLKAATKQRLVKTVTD
jgi:hypothetical protein